MRKRAAVLCGAAVVVAGTFTALPADASTRRLRKQRPAAKTHLEELRHQRLPDAPVRVAQGAARPRATRTGKQITLALSRVPHTAKKYQGPLLVNPGGPGGSGLTLAGFVAVLAAQGGRGPVRRHRLRPARGGQEQPALDCKPGHFDPVRPDSVPSTPAIEKANLQRAKSFAAACGKKYASLLPYIDTISAVQDMDSIRAALGAEKINYFGYSYGTYLGAVYAKLFPRARAAPGAGLDRRPHRRLVRRQPRPGLRLRRPPQGAHGLDRQVQLDVQARHRPGQGRGQVVRDAGGARQEAGAAGKVGASELEDTFIPGGYYNGYWPYLAEAFAAYVNDKNADPLVEAYENFAAVDASGDNGYSVYTVGAVP